MLRASVTFCCVKFRHVRKFERCNIGGELKLDGTAISRLTCEAVGTSQAFEVANPESAGGIVFLLVILSLSAGVDVFLVRLL